jgi:hypothetical protein
VPLWPISHELIATVAIGALLVFGSAVPVPDELRYCTSRARSR